MLSLPEAREPLEQAAGSSVTIKGRNSSSFSWSGSYGHNPGDPQPFTALSIVAVLIYADPNKLDWLKTVILLPGLLSIQCSHSRL